MDRVLGLNDLMAEVRTAETPAASTVHHPFGDPAGPGLFHVKGLQLPAYIQNVAHAFRRKGVPESEAIARAVGVVRDWAQGRTPGGKGHVHPDVQAAAAKAIAEWEAAKAAAHGSRFNQFHLPAGAGGGQFTTAGGAGKGGGAPAKGGPGQKGPAATHRPAGKTKAEHKAALLKQAKADREKAHHLQRELHALERQAHSAAQSAKKQAAASAKGQHQAAAAAHAAGHIHPHAKKAAPGKGKHHHATTAAHHAQSHVQALHGQIAGLRKQIRSLLAAASSLEAQARSL